MTKIKDIRDRLFKDPNEYTEIRLLIAKRTLSFFIALYYVSFLFTIGGFSFYWFDIRTLSQITFHIYTVLVIMMAWFFYELVVYGVHVYADNQRWLIIAAL
jgi:hypothetical protein